MANSALVYEPKCGEREKWSCWVSASEEYSCTHGALTNFGDLTPYLTYEGTSNKPSSVVN
jgi:hypothetical protein